MVKESLQKVKNHLDKFDKCIKERFVVNAVNYQNWGMDYIKGAYEEEVIPFVKNLRESFKLFEVGLYKEIVEIVVCFLDSGCSKHITGQRDELINFVSKFIGTIRFDNGNFAAIMGYEDL
ncbi:hypothetical protein Tco_1180024 [Tanacetum coccineum]